MLRERPCLLALPDCARILSCRGFHVLAHKAETGELRTARGPSLLEHGTLLRALWQLGCPDLNLETPGLATEREIVYEWCEWEDDSDESCAIF